MAAFELPAHLPPILVQALENQRAYGSESMFVAGRLALREADPWIGLCWLGDSPVAAIDIDGELVDLGPKGHTSERWNSGSGVKGPVHVWVGGAANVARVAGYTDGLAVDDVPTDETLVSLMDRSSLWLPSLLNANVKPHSVPTNRGRRVAGARSFERSTMDWTTCPRGSVMPT